jgi:hypothetical protein
VNQAERQKKAEFLDRLAHWLDDRFAIPGTGIRFGVEGLLGLVPGIGDTATSLISLYLVAEARRLGAPKRMIVRMLFNVFVDWLIGLIPLAGDIFDIAYKANRKNITLLQRYLSDRPDS